MATNTNNLNLVKPDYSESADIGVINGNMDIIDNAYMNLMIVNEESGTTAYIDDASNMNLENIIFYGESKQMQTSGSQFLAPLKVSEQTINNVTAKMVDGYVVLNGANSGSGAIDFYVCGSSGVYESLELPSGEYTISTDKALGENLHFYVVRSDGTVLKALQRDILSQVIEIEGTEKYRVFYRVLSGGSFNNVSVKIMFNAGTTALPWEKYTGGKPAPNPDYPQPIESKVVNRVVVTENNEPYQSQTVNLSAPIELNGIGDVRDTDKLKKFRVVVFDGSNDEGWVFNELSQRLMIEGLPIKRTSNNNETPNILCTQFLAKTPNETYNKVEGITVNTYGVLHIYSDNFNTADVSLWKSHLQSNPMTVVYELAEPIETALPQADIDAIKQLHTYKPNTVVMNDADAEMDVQYVADTKTYIDNKFNELATALVAESEV